MSDIEGKATRVGASERGQRMSFNESHHTHQNRRALPPDHPQNRIRKKQKDWGAHAAGVLVSPASPR